MGECDLRILVDNITVWVNVHTRCVAMLLMHVVMIGCQLRWTHHRPSIVKCRLSNIHLVRIIWRFNLEYWAFSSCGLSCTLILHKPMVEALGRIVISSSCSIPIKINSRIIILANYSLCQELGLLRFNACIILTCSILEKSILLMVLISFNIQTLAQWFRWQPTNQAHVLLLLLILRIWN